MLFVIILGHIFVPCSTSCSGSRTIWPASSANAEDTPTLAAFTLASSEAAGHVGLQDGTGNLQSTDNYNTDNNNSYNSHAGVLQRHGATVQISAPVYIIHSVSKKDPGHV